MSASLRHLAQNCGHNWLLNVNPYASDRKMVTNPLLLRLRYPRKASRNIPISCTKFSIVWSSRRLRIVGLGTNLPQSPFTACTYPTLVFISFPPRLRSTTKGLSLTSTTSHTARETTSGSELAPVPLALLI